MKASGGEETQLHVFSNLAVLGNDWSDEHLCCFASGSHGA